LRSNILFLLFVFVHILLSLFFNSHNLLFSLRLITTRRNSRGSGEDKQTVMKIINTMLTKAKF